VQLSKLQESFAVSPQIEPLNSIITMNALPIPTGDEDALNSAVNIVDSGSGASEWIDEEDDDDMDFEPNADSDPDFFDPSEDVDAEFHGTIFVSWFCRTFPGLSKDLD
jgi:hypothetical protein